MRYDSRFTQSSRGLAHAPEDDNLSEQNTPEPPSAQSPKPEPWNADLEYRALTAGGLAESASTADTRHSPSRPQAEPISVASVWQMNSPDAADAALSGNGAFVYRRDGHPNQRSLAEKLALLHGAQRAVITAQGMSAIGAVALAALQPGSQVWLGHELYGKSSKLFDSDMARWGVATRWFDPTSAADIDKLKSSKTDLVLIETLTNPRVRLPQLGALAAATHAAGGILLVDNTFATHLLCQPLRHGADLVVESLSKQVNGHSDSMLGMLAGNDMELLERVRDVVSTFGMASSPLDCYLTHRGLMSLAVRMERACANALKLAQALEALEQVTCVDYPGLPSHPQHRLAGEQLRGGHGWMLSFHMDFTRAELQRLFSRLQPEIAFVPSLGDVSTTVSHPATTSHRGLSPPQRQTLGIGEGTIRVSCGIEPTEWLLERFLFALK